MKITGAEFKEWHNTAWPEDYIWVDETLLDDGRDLYNETGNIVIEDGEVFVVPAIWCIEKEGDISGNPVSVRSLIKKWRNERSHTTLVVVVPKEQENQIRTICRTNGWKIA